MPVAIAIHALSAVIWVGGMFFAYMALRPVSGALEVDVRLRLWAGALRKFFAWVWITVVALPVTGYWMVSTHFGGMGNVGLYINIMQGLGWLMILIYLHVYFAPYRRLKRLVANQDFDAAAGQLNQIRLMIGINLVLGLIVVIVAAIGQYL